MRRVAVAAFRAAAAVVGTALDRRRRQPATTHDLAAQRRWVLLNRAVPPARRGARAGPHRHRRHGGYGGAGAGLPG